MKLLALVCLLAFVTPAAADNKVAAEAVYKEGQTRYLQEDYEGAAQLFKRAYELDADPVYLFNIGQAYRFAKKCADARDHYQRYLGSTSNPPNADTVKGYIAEMDECAKQQAVFVPKPVEPAPQPEPAPAPPAIVDEPAGGNPGMRTAGIVVGIVGLALAGGGFYFMSQVSAAEDDANDVLRTCNVMWSKECDDRRREADDKGELNEKLMLGSFVGGAAAIGTGVVLYMLGRDRGERAPVAVTPMRGGAMVSIDF